MNIKQRVNKENGCPFALLMNFLLLIAKKKKKKLKSASGKYLYASK
jgi:hypothetical protein